MRKECYENTLHSWLNRPEHLFCVHHSLGRNDAIAELVKTVGRSIRYHTFFTLGYEPLATEKKPARLLIVGEFR